MKQVIDDGFENCGWWQLARGGITSTVYYSKKEFERKVSDFEGMDCQGMLQGSLVISLLAGELEVNGSDGANIKAEGGFRNNELLPSNSSNMGQVAVKVSGTKTCFCISGGFLSLYKGSRDICS